MRWNRQKICESGKYQDKTGKPNCEEYGAGNYVSDDRTACNTCEAGYKYSGDGTRVACSGNLYQPNTGQNGCLTCPDGYTCNGTSATLNCPNGTFLRSNGEYTSCTFYYINVGTTCTSCAADGCTATSCNNGHYSNSSGTCETCPKGYYCTGNERTPCSIGTYLDTTGGTSSSDCKTCASKTAYCTTCDTKTGECNACEEGYNLTNGTCEEESPTSCGEGFDDSLFMRVKTESYDMCVTKYNMGDKATLTIPSSVTSVQAGGATSCGSTHDYTSKCCWSGNTAATDYCGSGNGNLLRLHKNRV